MTDDVAPLTLGDLLAADAGLRLLCGGDAAQRRRVAGAHTVEIERPTDWLEPEWVMLTTGVRLKDRPDAQRALVAELDDAGATALGFGVDLVFAEVPAALLERARERDFPVFEVPLHIAFRDIVRRVDTSLLSGEVRASQRLQSLQRYLMDALEDPEPRRAVVMRLARFTDASVTLAGPGGEAVEQAGPPPPPAVLAALTAHTAPLVARELEGWQMVATPARSGLGTPLWLVISRAGTAPLPRITREAARATAPVLAALARLDSLAATQGDAMRAGLLDELLTAGPAESVTLAARAAAFGLDLTQPAHVVIAAPRVGRDTPAPALRDALERLPGPHLATRRGPTLVALVQAEQERICEAVLTALAPTDGAWAAGIGRGVRRVDAISTSLRDAEIALARAAADPDVALLGFDDLDLATLVLAETPRERLEPKVEALLAPLREHPALLEALTAYFAHDLDVMATARAMHLHHNSLRYRLGRIETLLGCSLKDPATIASIHLALSA